MATWGSNRTGPGGAASPAPARRRRAVAGQAAPPGPVRFGPDVAEYHEFRVGVDRLLSILGVT